jgi:hypothetical protein
MLKKKIKTIYDLKRLIPGEVIGMEGWYAAVPEEGYKGHPFKIKYLTSEKTGPADYKYTLLEIEVKDWNKAAAFRKMTQTIPGRSGFYTLGYFKMKD